VNSKAERLDKSFIERQRLRLTKLRNELADATQGKEAEEKDINSQSSGQSVEYEDDAQRLATLELDGNVVARNAQRLAQVDRALKKIAEGTYGLSDASDYAIPRERLEATPEAIYTVEEQAARESAPRRGSGQK
jgi:DnaK suppressor protein